MKAEYIDHLGSDLTVVNAARVSFDKTSKFKEESFKYPKAAQEYAEMKRGVFSHIGCVVKYLDDKDQKLIKYLAEHGHWTPFGHPQITLTEPRKGFVVHANKCNYRPLGNVSRLWSENDFEPFYGSITLKN